jgi:hypothetical protein
MDAIKERIGSMIDEHGGLRAAARAIGCDPAYLLRLYSGEKNNPSDAMLAKLGLKKQVRHVLQNKEAKMDIEGAAAEAAAWIRGEHSMADMIPSDPRETWVVRIAQADAARVEQAYWVLKAHKEGLCK